MKPKPISKEAVRAQVDFFKRASVSTVCSVDGCDRERHSRGYCGKHYLQRWKRGGLVTRKYSIAEKDDSARFDSNVELIPETSCHWWTGVPHSTGYGRFGHKGKQMQAHRYAYERAKGQIPSGLFVCHHCDNRLCVNPEHLFIGSHDDNMADMTSKGRQLKGCEIHNAKLTESDVRDIRKRYSAGESYSAIAAEFLVSPSAVHFACSRKNWKHVA